MNVRSQIVVGSIKLHDCGSVIYATLTDRKSHDIVMRNRNSARERVDVRCVRPLTICVVATECATFAFFQLKFSGARSECGNVRIVGSDWHPMLEMKV